MELERTCWNCTFFFQDKKDFDTGFGVCMERETEEFEPFIDKVLEEMDFSICYDLYLKKRMDGENAACDRFEEIETIDLFDEDEE